jgi:hypothetical protein
VPLREGGDRLGSERKVWIWGKLITRRWARVGRASARLEFCRVSVGPEEQKFTSSRGEGFNYRRG